MGVGCVEGDITGEKRGSFVMSWLVSSSAEDRVGDFGVGFHSQEADESVSSSATLLDELDTRTQMARI